MIQASFIRLALLYTTEIYFICQRFLNQMRIFILKLLFLLKLLDQFIVLVDVVWLTESQYRL